MIPIEVLVTFFITSLLLGLAPGPDNIFVLAQSAMYGRHAGLMVVLGLCSGLIVHTVAVALGVAAIFQTSLIAFSVLKILGICYLLFLAWKSFRSSVRDAQAGAIGKVSSLGLYRRGVILNISNPKVSIFFLAFIPQFADPARGSVSIQILLFGCLFILSTLLVFSSIALLAGTLSHWFSSSLRAQKILNRISGVVFLGIALMLAIMER